MDNFRWIKKFWIGLFLGFLSLFSCQDNNSNIPLGKAENITIKIDGMMCKDACGAKIKKELKEINGVDDVEVNFVGKDEDNSVRVAYFPQECSQEDMKKKIEKIGGGTLYKVKSMNVENP